MTGTASAYVDCGSDGHTLWQIRKQGNGYYAIKIVDQDPDFGTVSGNAVDDERRVGREFRQHGGVSFCR